MKTLKISVLLIILFSFAGASVIKLTGNKLNETSNLKDTSLRNNKEITTQTKVNLVKNKFSQFPFKRKYCSNRMITEFKNSLCKLGILERDYIDALVVGDSHAGHYSRLADNLLRSLNKTGYIHTIDSCFLATNTSLIVYQTKRKYHSQHKCERLKSKIHQFAESSRKQKLFIIGESFNQYATVDRGDPGDTYKIESNSTIAIKPKQAEELFRTTFTSFIENIVKYDHKVLILGQAPSIGGNGINMPCAQNAILNPNSKKCGRVLSDWKERVKVTKSTLNSLQRKYPKHIYVYFPDDLLCNEKYARCSITLDKTLLFRDAHHLNDIGSEILWRYFDTKGFKKFMRL